MELDIRLAAVGAAALAVLGYAFLGGGDAIPEDIALGNGRVEAVQVDIATKIGGRVAAVDVAEGEIVEAERIVAKIDAAQLQARLLRANADIASAESQIAAAAARVAESQSRLILAEAELSRAKALVDQGHTSKEAFDTRSSQREVAKANLTASEANLVAQQRSADAARAAALEIQTQIDDCVLKSPVTGRVLYRLSEPGEVLGNGGKVLTLLNLEDVYMEIFLPAAQAHRVSIGAEARVKLDILDFALPAKVSFVSPEAQFTPKEVETPSEREKLMFRVKVRFPQKLILRNIDRVKTGVRGVAYVRLTNPGEAAPSAWPEFLMKLPPSAAQTGQTG